MGRLAGGRADGRASGCVAIHMGEYTYKSVYGVYMGMRSCMPVYAHMGGYQAHGRTGGWLFQHGGPPYMMIYAYIYTVTCTYILRNTYDHGWSYDGLTIKYTPIWARRILGGPPSIRPGAGRILGGPPSIRQGLGVYLVVHQVYAQGPVVYLVDHQVYENAKISIFELSR